MKPVGTIHQVVKQSFALSENNKLIYIYKKFKTGKIVEITSVGLNIRVKRNWITILYYDSAHGYLHRHERISIDRDDYVDTRVNVRQKGTVRRLLRWSIDDIKKNYLYYKKRFIQRNRRYLVKKKIIMEIY